MDLNATQAAIRTGYSKRTARAIGQENLTKPDIAARISELQAERSERTKIKADQVVQEIANLLFYDARDVLSWGPEGFRIKPSDELTVDQQKIVNSVSESPSQRGWRRSVKFYDRLKAAELLGKHLGMFTDRVELSGRSRKPITIVEVVHPAETENGKEEA